MSEAPKQLHENFLPGWRRWRGAVVAQTGGRFLSAGMDLQNTSDAGGGGFRIGVVCRDHVRHSHAGDRRCVHCSGRLDDRDGFATAGILIDAFHDVRRARAHRPRIFVWRRYSVRKESRPPSGAGGH